MHVIATAGHVDHGKSTLVRALTGQDPDRLAEERRRGLSIELGYAWTTLPGAGEVAFVDVPGHARFVSTMLAGVGPVPAALLVVAADDPWMPQAAEHLAALDALGVRHGVVAVTRVDLADPAASAARAAAEVGRTALAGAPVVPVSARTGEGLDDLRRALVDLVGALPAPDPAADVRLWVDRRFTVRGAGTVVTGTLPAGTVRVGDTLALGGEPLRVRGLQTLGRSAEEARGVARVALNLVGAAAERLERGDVLVSPGAWRPTTTLDVRLRGLDAGGAPPERPILHVGAAAVAVHHRPLGDDVARLRLEAALPLRIGDRALLRDPGGRRTWGVEVLDPLPPALRRRGAAAARVRDLAAHPGPGARAEVARRDVVRLEDLRRIGVDPDDVAALGADHAADPEVVVADGWALSGRRADAATRRAVDVVAEHERAAPLAGGLPLAVLAERLGLPTAGVARAVVHPPLRVEAGRVLAGRRLGLPPAVEAAVAAVLADLADAPFAAPTADRLRELGLDDRTASAAARAGRLLRPAAGIVLPPEADRRAAELLAALPQPFTTSEARQCLGTSRRVALPLLDWLDRRGLTRRLPDDRRTVVGQS